MKSAGKRAAPRPPCHHQSAALRPPCRQQSAALRPPCRQQSAALRPSCSHRRKPMVSFRSLARQGHRASIFKDHRNDIIPRRRPLLDAVDSGLGVSIHARAQPALQPCANSWCATRPHSPPPNHRIYINPVVVGGNARGPPSVLLPSAQADGLLLITSSPRPSSAYLQGPSQ
jgi:hypothetical protein